MGRSCRGNLSRRRRWILIFLPSCQRRSTEAMVGLTTPGPPPSFPCFTKVTLVPPSLLSRRMVSLFLVTLTPPRSHTFSKVHSRQPPFFSIDSLHSFYHLGFCFNSSFTIRSLYFFFKKIYIFSIIILCDRCGNSMFSISLRF